MNQKLRAEKRDTRKAGQAWVENGINRKLICDFLLVINTNLAHTLHRFRDIALESPKSL